MKKINLIIALFTFVCLTVGCSQDCYKCTLAATSTTVEICEDDAGSASALEDAVDAYVFLGYACAKK